MAVLTPTRLTVAVLGVSALLGLVSSISRAQVIPAKSEIRVIVVDDRPPLESSHSNHGLTLILGQSQTPEPSDSHELKTCLSRNLPLACKMLVTTVKNEGNDTLLTWWDTCGHWDMTFDLQKSDGTWEPFPLDNSKLPLCTRSFTYVEKLAPGDTHVEQIRLADLALDTALPDDGRIQPRQSDSEVFTSKGPNNIRLHWNVAACITSRKLKPDEVPNALIAESFCEADSEVSQKSVIRLQSNELNLSLGPSR